MNKTKFDDTVDFNLFLIDLDVWLDITKQICLIRKSPYTRKVSKLPKDISIEDFMMRLFPRDAELCITKEIKEGYLRAFEQDLEFLKDIPKNIQNEVYEYMSSLSEGKIVD